MSKTILNIKNLEIGYKDPITNVINLNAEEGNLVCIIGRNGVGKSTLLNTLSGILKPLSGDIFYNDINFPRLSSNERSRLISYVPSRQEYVSNLNVYELVSMGRSPYTNMFDKHSTNDKDIIEKALIEFNLENLQKKSLYEVSDGERQRAMICRAIVQETPVILLDEPTAFLDYYAKQKLLFDLSVLVKEKNKCIIFSSHDLQLSVKYSELVWLFHHNEVKSFTTNDLKNSGLLNELMNFEFN